MQDSKKSHWSPTQLTRKLPPRKRQSSIQSSSSIGAILSGLFHGIVIVLCIFGIPFFRKPIQDIPVMNVDFVQSNGMQAPLLGSENSKDEEGESPEEDEGKPDEKKEAPNIPAPSSPPKPVLQQPLPFEKPKEEEKKVEKADPEAVPLPDEKKKEEKKPDEKPVQTPPVPKKEEEPIKKEKLDEVLNEVEKDDKKKNDDSFLSVLKNVEKNKKKGVEKKKTEPSKGKPRKGVSKGALEGSLSASEEDGIRRQIYPHWSIPGGVKNADDLIVELEIQLEADGSVTSVKIVDQDKYNRDPAFRAAADSARRAVKLSSPLKIPQDKMELLRSFSLRFNPKEVL